MKKDLGERIKSRRKMLNMTQEELAKLIGYTSKSTINKIEKGINDIPMSKVAVFAKALRTTEEYIMGWEKPEPKPIIEDPYDFGLLSEAERAELNLIINNNFAMFMNTGKTLSEHDREEIKRILIKAYFENRE